MSLEIDSRACVSAPACQVSAVAPGLHLPFNSRFLGGPRPATSAAVFLDRDGVIVRDVHYLRRPSQIDFLGHVETLATLKDRYYLVIATNQSGIARKLFTELDLVAIHSDLGLRLASWGVVIDAFYYCPHLSADELAPAERVTAELNEYRMDCDCRKPKPGMMFRAAREYGLDLKRSYMIGDSQRDVEAGRAAGLADSIRVGEEGARDLAQAVHRILGGAA
jgi:histidinol-phosphate phosphatase family protein